MIPRNLFGTRNWDDVRSVVTARTRRRFPRVSADDIEDAVSWAMLDLIDYWVQLPSSIIPGKPGKTFWYACKRGTWMAVTQLTQEWDDRDKPVEFLSPGGEETAPSSARRRSSRTPEDIVLDNMERCTFEDVLEANLTEHEGWLRPFLSGISTRQEARRQGLDHSVIARRRQNGVRILASKLRLELS